MEAMEMKEIEAAVEGILFASGEPVQVDRLQRGFKFLSIHVSHGSP